MPIIKISDISNRYTSPIKGIEISSNPFMDDLPEKKKNAAEPIKNREDVDRIIKYLVKNKRYRDNLLFVMGINFGLRCGDLVRLKYGHIFNPDGSFKSKVRIEEEKTRRHDDDGNITKNGKIRTCYMTDAVVTATMQYINNIFSFSSTSIPANAESIPASSSTSTGCNSIDLNDYIFKSESNHCPPNSHLEVRSVERILKEVCNDKLGIDVHASTHMLRKTFAYHVIMSAPDRTSAITLLQRTLGHSSAVTTLAYAGVTDAEIENTCKNLNLGGSVLQDICYSIGLAI